MVPLRIEQATLDRLARLARVDADDLNALQWLPIGSAPRTHLPSLHIPEPTGRHVPLLEAGVVGPGIDLLLHPCPAVAEAFNHIAANVQQF